MQKKHINILVLSFLTASVLAALIRMAFFAECPREADQLLLVTRISLLLVSALLVIMTRFLVFISGLMALPRIVNLGLAVFLLSLGLVIQAIGFVFSMWAGSRVEYLPFFAIGLYQILRFRGPAIRLVSPHP